MAGRGGEALASRRFTDRELQAEGINPASVEAQELRETGMRPMHHHPPPLPHHVAAVSQGTADSSYQAAQHPSPGPAPPAVQVGNSSCSMRQHPSAAVEETSGEPGTSNSATHSPADQQLGGSKQVRQAADAAQDTTATANATAKAAAVNTAAAVQAVKSAAAECGQAAADKAGDAVQAAKEGAAQAVEEARDSSLGQAALEKKTEYAQAAKEAAVTYSAAAVEATGRALAAGKEKAVQLAAVAAEKTKKVTREVLLKAGDAMHSSGEGLKAAGQRIEAENSGGGTDSGKAAPNASDVDSQSSASGDAAGPRSKL